MIDFILTEGGRCLVAGLVVVAVAAMFVWSTSKAMQALGWVAAVASYAAHRAWLRWMVGMRLDAPTVCISCGQPLSVGHPQAEGSQECRM